MDLIPCCRHKHFKAGLIYIGKEKAQLLCDYCMDDNVITEENIQMKQLFHINKIISEPESILRKLNLGIQFQKFFTIILENPKQIEQEIILLEKQLKQVQEELLNKFQVLMNGIQKISEMRQKLLKDTLEIVNFESLKEVLQGLSQQKESIPEAIEFIQQKLFMYFSNLEKPEVKPEIQQKLQNLIYEVENQVMNEIEIMINKDKLDQLTNLVDSNQKKIAYLTFPTSFLFFDSKLLNLEFSLKLYKQIYQNTKYQIPQLIYLGSQEGLNNTKFWQKVLGKSNLIMILKSKSGNIFGGFSTCIWQQNSGVYFKDDLNSTFLFSQTHNEIYPSIKNSNQIYCSSSYGPTFGNGSNGYDMCIGSDFQSGSSNLGIAYQCTNVSNKTTHLFGQTTPNIEECEIFEFVSFKEQKK